jgi:hypothetical protein
VIEQAKLWLMDLYSWQAQLSWSESTAIVFLFVGVAIIAIGFDIKDEFGRKRDDQEEGKF